MCIIESGYLIYNYYDDNKTKPILIRHSFSIKFLFQLNICINYTLREILESIGFIDITNIYNSYTIRLNLLK